AICHVTAAGLILEKRVPSGRGIGVAGGIAVERLVSRGGAITRRGVVEHRAASSRRVVAAGAISMEWLGAAGCICSGRCEIEECLITDGCVIATGRFRKDPLHRRNTSGSVEAPVRVAERAFTGGCVLEAGGVDI